MRTNPYRAMIAASREPITAGLTRLPGRQEAFVGANGEINASSTADLLNQIGTLIQAYSKNEVVQGSVQDPKATEERRQVLAEAFNSNDPKEMMVLGEALVAEIIDTTAREGFARRLLQFSELGQGEINQVRLRQHNITAYMAVSTTEVQPVVIRDRKLIPPEFNLNAYVLIDLKELAQSTGDLLEEKYEEALEATMVQEDRLWKKMADSAATIRNTLQYFGTFTPAVFTRMRQEVAYWGIPVPTYLIAYDLWNDIVSNPDFSSLFDPVTKWELIQEGYLGTILGVSILTDSFRQPLLRVLNQGEVYAVGAPLNHGVVRTRGAMAVNPIDKFNQGINQKGWFLSELISMVIGNSMSVAKGQRV